MSSRKFLAGAVGKPVKAVLQNLNVRLALWGVFFYALAVIILGINYIPQQLDLKEDQPSPRDIYASQGIVFESDVLTEAAREEAARQVKPSYKLDPAVLEELEFRVREVFAEVNRIRNDEELDEGEKVVSLQEAGLTLPEGNLLQLVWVEQEDIARLEEKTLSLLREVFGPGVPESALADARVKILEQAGKLESVPEGLQAVAAAILEGLNFRPNFVIDSALTAEEREKAREAVGPVQVTIRQGEKIVGVGEVVTAADIEVLQKLGLLRTRSPVTSLLGLALFILINSLLTIFFLYQYRRQVLTNEAHFILLGILFIMGLILIKAITAINIGGRAEISNLVSYMIPVAAVSMLVAVLLDTKAALFLTMVLAIIVGVATGSQLQFSIAAFIGGVTGVYSISKLSQRSDLAKASLYITLANVFSILALGFLLNYNLTMFTVALSMGIINGVLSSVLTIGSLPFLETAFGITTSVKLLELSDPNQPVLKRLLLEAPGTYHHSILVGNLAEAAADAVGANSLLARVASYYHDIGKLKRPYFFIENQLTADNPHDKLAPTLSTLIITSHVKDGVELAKEYRLPQVIKDIINQHHGTGLVSYFYHKAQENNRGEELEEGDFRYDCPKPQTKEAAIVLLADTVEAAVRSIQKPTPGRIEGTVRKVIKDKLEDGQLEECDLTFKELDIIAQSFVRVLSGIFHSRIEYPDHVLKEMERRKIKDAGVHKQPTGQNIL
ncbi:MAG: HD family phosphohydrolase [Bacillota bacterium]|jgi:putative nucleotidyltransferase with HDIG domain